jgi:hypothetical protein
MTTKPLNLVTIDTGDAITKIANLMVATAKSKDAIEKLIAPLRAAKIVIGTIKKDCALALRFQAIFENAKLDEHTCRNYLSAVRASVNDGIKFSFNPSREKAKANAKAKVASKPVDAAPAGIEPIPTAPAGAIATTPKRLISMPSDAIDAIVVALSNVRATCTQDTWLHVLTLNPALSQFLDRANGVWKTPTPEVIPAPEVTPAPAKRSRKAK